MDPSLAILVLVAIIYLLVIIAVVFVIISKRKGKLKQTIDPLPKEHFKNELEEK